MATLHSTIQKVLVMCFTRSNYISAINGPWDEAKIKI